MIVCGSLSDPAAVTPDIRLQKIGVAEGSILHSGAPRQDKQSWPFQRQRIRARLEVRENLSGLSSWTEVNIWGVGSSHALREYAPTFVPDSFRGGTPCKTLAWMFNPVQALHSMLAQGYEGTVWVRVLPCRPAEGDSTGTSSEMYEPQALNPEP